MDSPAPGPRKDNPHLAICPHCGTMICLKCVEIEERLGELCGCDVCNERSRRLEKRQADHLAQCDHAMVESAVPPTIGLTVTVREGSTAEAPPLDAPWLAARRAAAGAYLRKRIAYCESMLPEEGEEVGPYDERITTWSDEANLLGWMWEQVDPAGYTTWLDGGESHE